MPRHLRWPLLYVCLLLGLAGCTISTYSGVPTPLPCAAQTAAAATATPTPSLGTRSEGPVVITTDRTVYAPSDMVVVTVINQIHASLNLPVVVEFGLRQRCPDLYQAEHLQGGIWEDVPVCSAPTEGGDATLIGPDARIAQGQTYAFVLTASRQPAAPSYPGPFPTGTYRVEIRYNLIVPIDRGGVGGAGVTGGYGFAAYSQPFQVCTCGVCA